MYQVVENGFTLRQHNSALSLNNRSLYVCFFVDFLNSFNTKEHIQKYKIKCFCKCRFPVRLNWQSIKNQGKEK